MSWFEQGYNNFMLKTEPKTVIYLSGKMKGLPENGYPLFHSEAKRLRALDYMVLNPAENPEQPTWEDYLKQDIPLVCKSDKVALLDNWQTSEGAKLEIYIAEKLKIPVVMASNMLPVPRETILQEAQRLVHGDRQSTYGHPHDDYLCTTQMFNVWMSKKYRTSFYMSPVDGAMFLEFVKISREGNAPKRDNRTDGAGYWECIDMIEARMEELREARGPVGHGIFSGTA